MDDPKDISRQLRDFWFGAEGSPGYGAPRQVWWAKDQAFDEDIRVRFAGPYERARAGAYDNLAGHGKDWTALVILLDQVPRNLFRESPRAFESDPKSLALAKQALARGIDARLVPAMAAFLYMPLQHSEAIADQERSVALFQALGFAKTYEFALRHRDIVARFGRFPHRNAVVGRDSTAEELEFLKQPRSSF